MQRFLRRGLDKINRWGNAPYLEQGSFVVTLRVFKDWCEIHVLRLVVGSGRMLHTGTIPFSSTNNVRMSLFVFVMATFPDIVGTPSYSLEIQWLHVARLETVIVCD